MADKSYKGRAWRKPNQRAKGYANERKQKVHIAGPKAGQELTDYEAGMRSGYLQCQNDHASLYKYQKAKDMGYGKKEAGRLSNMPMKSWPTNGASQKGGRKKN